MHKRQKRLAIPKINFSTEMRVRTAMPGGVQPIAAAPDTGSNEWQASGKIPNAAAQMIQSAHLRQLGDAKWQSGPTIGRRDGEDEIKTAPCDSQNGGASGPIPVK